MTHPTPIRRVAGTRPRLPAAFCCQGGAAKGYAAWVGHHALTHLTTPAEVAA
ncbi:hypothetical protein ABZ085_07560 [Streptomyces albidoflavus]|uniref:hypothetical protein n=1 Tax=Streptomyces albidoflavus TaxID=1886 RepID=UPI00339DACFC